MKFMKTLALLALAAALATLAAVGCSGSPEAYETFSLAMDQMAGKGNWTAEKHSSGFFGNALTVEGLKVTGPDGEKVEVASVELKKLLSKSELEIIIASPDWRDRPATSLADSIVVKGFVKSRQKESGALETSGFDELNLKNVSLAAQDSSGAAGMAGYLKAARIGQLTYKNIRGEAPGQKGVMTMTLGELSAASLAFDAPPLEGLEHVDDSGLATVISSFSAKSLGLKDLALAVTPGEGEEGELTFTLASLDEKDIKGFRSISSMAVKGVKMVVKTDEYNPNLDFGLESISASGVDMTEYFQKFTPALAAAFGGGDPERALNRAQNLADFFVSPFTFNELSVGGFHFAVGDLLTLKMKEAKVTGPAVAGAVPLRQTNIVTGLEIILPEDPKFQEGDTAELYKFGQDFGLTRFYIDAESRAVNDPATGRTVYETTKFHVRDLVDITFKAVVNGLTPQRLETLKDVSLNGLFMVFMAPEEVLGDLAFEEVDLTLVNHGLVERIYGFIGKTKMSGATVEHVRDMAAGSVPLAITFTGGEYLADPSVLAAQLGNFLKDPKSLRLTLTPQPPVSFTSAKEMGGDTNKVLNSLNLTVSANGQAAPALVFNVPQRPAPLYDEDLTDEEIEELLRQMEEDTEQE